MKVNWAKTILAIALMFGSNTQNFAQIFSEQSAAVGINHTFQAAGLMGGGACFFDYDLDGDEDLYLNGGTAKDELYKNNGNGTFTKVLDATGLEMTQTFNTTAVISGDVDNDGDRDLFVSTWEQFSTQTNGRNLFFVNQGDGTFVESGEAAGFNESVFTIGANFLDYNRDGYLDIYVINHVESPAFLYDNNGVIVGFDHDCYPNFLYRNNGDLTFTEVSTTVGLTAEDCTLAAAATDYDMDGDVDLYLANDFGPFLGPNQMFQNQYPNESFTDVGPATGSDIAMYGMGVAIGDIDHDQDLDYYITNLGRNVLLQNDGGQFTDITTSANVENTYASASETELATGWGTAFFDVNNDTWEDLFVSNGRIPSLPTLPTAFNDPDKLYLNNGDLTFTDVSDANSVSDPNYGRGMAWSDYDKDGDLDFVVVNLGELGGTIKFYRNDSPATNHYVQFALKGSASNRDGYGSKVWLYADGQVYLREISGGGESFCSQHSSIAHFGLGAIDAIDSVRVEWPNGAITSHMDLATDTQHLLEETPTVSTQAVLGSQGFDFTIFPNPASDQIHLTFSSDQVGKGDLIIRTTTGSMVYQETVDVMASNNLTIQLPERLASGIYWISFQNSDGLINKKLIKK